MLELFAFALIGLFVTIVALGHYFLFTAIAFNADGFPVTPRKNNADQHVAEGAKRWGLVPLE